MICIKAHLEYNSEKKRIRCPILLQNKTTYNYQNKTCESPFLRLNSPATQARNTLFWDRIVY